MTSPDCRFNEDGDAHAVRSANGDSNPNRAPSNTGNDMTQAFGWPRAAIERLFRWAILALLLNALWEVAQLPLYGFASEPDGLRITLYVAHCVAGDVLIATLLFVFAASLLRDADWPRHRPWLGGATIVVSGAAYTAWSEWYNVYIAGAWSYNASMPIVGGIGLAPLAQWLVVPALTIALLRRWR